MSVEELGRGDGSADELRGSLTVINCMCLKEILTGKDVSTWIFIIWIP